MDPKGRVIARGRARSRPAQQAPQQQQQAAAPSQPISRPNVPGERGDASSLLKPLSQMTVRDEGSEQQVGRGNIRGRRRINIENVLKTRPSTVDNKKGTSGKSIQLTSNYFPLITKTDWCLYHYRVDYAPDEDQTNVRKMLLRPHKDKIGEYIFDGTMMFTSNRLKPDVVDFFSVRDTDKQNIKITVKLVGDLMMGDGHYLQVYNILMRQCLKNLKLQLIGRDHYDAAAKSSYDDLKLEVWPGYKTSIRQHDPSILMCAEITHKIVRKENAYELYTKHINYDPSKYKDTFTNEILGSVILTCYNNKTYRIDDIDFNNSPRSTFTRNGEQVSYITYMKEKYNLRVQYPNQPMLVHKAKEREIRAGMSELIYLIPEFCQLTGLSEEMRNDFRFTRALADKTRVSAKDRVKRLLHLNKRFLEEPKVVEDLKKWNMSLSPNLVQFKGRVLPKENILLGGRTPIVSSGPNVDWTNSLRSNPMRLVMALKKWIIVYPARHNQGINQFISQLIKVGQGMDFPISQPLQHEIRDDKEQTYINELEHVISERDPNFIICVVSNNQSSRYSTIKKKCCVDRAVPNQVVVAKNVAKNMSITTKIAIQINAKLGGAPWSVEVPLKGLMVVGFDVSHDARDKGKSFGAMVASMDEHYSRYYSTVTPHTNGEEMSNELSLNIVKAARKFQMRNGTLPSRILIYRDGVGEGQIPFVYEHELEFIKKELNHLYGQVPKLCYIIVTKRINTRIFYNEDNPPPGTVVDDCITSPEKYDFFLVSQSVRQGTVAPTGYNIIYDSMGINPDKIQRLSYKMTHLYYNWSGTVRVPAPCQYAHKLAFLVGQNLHRSPNTAFDDLLYFL
uniref:Piwi domain-containing protein n=1 Tax=Clastoptera arizonana TaxID=38151 RepID=A0A1B6DVK7_9HEMI